MSYLASGPFQVPWSDYTPTLWHALIKTIEYTVVSFIGAAILGLAVALLRLSKLRVLRIIATIYTELFKNIPLLAIIFVTYYGLTSVNITLTVFEAGSLSLIVFYAAYLSEVFRAAISGVHAGQQEAAEALGLGWVATFVHVIFPQALRLALPGTNTMAVDLLKSTSLLVLISAGELMSEGKQITSATFRALEVYLVIAVIYFALCYPSSQLLLLLERKVRAGVPLMPRRRKRMAAARRLLAGTGSEASA